VSTEAGQILDQLSSTHPTGGASTEAQPSPTIQKAAEEPIASKLSILMERERQAVTRERMAKSQEEKLRERLKKIEEFESIKTDPKKALEALGLSYDQLTETFLKDGQVPPSVEIGRLRQELEEHKAQLRQQKDLELETQRKRVGEAETKAVTDFKSEISEYLKSNEQRYELIAFEEATDLVFDVIDEHYNRTIDPQTGVGKVMSIAEAADKTEEHFEKKYLLAKEKNKVKAFWANVPKNIQEQIKKQEFQRQPPKTLTNNMGPKVSEKSQRLPEDKRIQQIVAEQMAKMRSQFA
jgi:hypothetical protein